MQLASDREFYYCLTAELAIDVDEAHGGKSARGAAAGTVQEFGCVRPPNVNLYSHILRLSY